MAHVLGLEGEEKERGGENREATEIFQKHTQGLLFSSSLFGVLVIGRPCV